MAWIESHQTLWDHPKTRRASRRLGVADVQLVGHLHALWHWALDHAESGDLSRFDHEDVAIAARWDGDPEDFVAALAECGPGGGPGFLDRDGDALSLHNWARYTERLVARRDSSRKANHDRWHAARGIRAEGCEWCDASGPDPSALRSDSGRSADGHGPDSTRPDPTGPDPTPPSPGGDSGGQPDLELVADDPPTDDRFEEFWAVWPARNGKRRKKAQAHEQWRKKVPPAERDAAIRGAKHYADASNDPNIAAGAMDAFRWLRDREWPDWQQPARASPSPAAATVSQHASGRF